MKDKNIIFFDGVCELCDWFVNFVFKRDSKRQFLYASLQGETAKAYLQPADIQGLKSIIFFNQGAILKESCALKAIMKKLYPRLAPLLSLFPSFIFNIFYRFIAKRRYAFFGKKETGYQASPEQQKYFLK
ncbi:MAG: DCC1-like thiol-disulfide oxidoreductase family protein [Oligoflexia bacterium]|nr:DCC1-like thiol-disulfide oxidoreductase family protein [Oligoflexia bacterium]